MKLSVFDLLVNYILFILILFVFYEKIRFSHFNPSDMTYSKLEEQIPLNPEKTCFSTLQPTHSGNSLSSLTESVENIVGSDSDNDSINSEPFWKWEDDASFLKYLFGKKDDSSIQSYQSNNTFSSTVVNPAESEKDEAKVLEDEGCCSSLNLFRVW